MAITIRYGVKHFTSTSSLFCYVLDMFFESDFAFDSNAEVFGLFGQVYGLVVE